MALGVNIGRAAPRESSAVPKPQAPKPPLTRRAPLDYSGPTGDA